MVVVMPFIHADEDTIRTVEKKVAEGLNRRLPQIRKPYWDLKVGRISAPRKCLCLTWRKRANGVFVKRPGISPEKGIAEKAQGCSK